MKNIGSINKYILKGLVIGLLSLCVLPIGYKAKAAEKKEKIILIDPGHGGLDGGAVSKNGFLEKDINLIIGKMLKDELEKEGYQVSMTREEDKGLYDEKGTVREKKNQDLNNRCLMKKKTNCDMFLSIHLNMFPQSKYSGAQVWYSDYEESKKLAGILQNTLREELNPNNNREEKAALDTYKILRDGYKAPSVIIECGFLSNPIEEEKLRTPQYQESLAKAIAKAVNKYYSN
nr:N-acetylmuramoyl-L-alanine amidase CwlD [Clostridium simiarum]